jgi:polyhydroxyalkanoate synthesis regulator phasin
MQKFSGWYRCAGTAPQVVLATVALLAVAVPALQSREKDKLSYGEGLIVNVPFPEAEVAQVVQEVAQNGIIRGTKEYNKDEYVGGAKAADSTRAFPVWTEGGKVFYKVRLQALDPRNFKDSGDLGTLAVRYVVQPQGDKNTVLRINAVFVEDFRHTVHTSNGSVEGGEYKDIRDHLEAIEVMKQQTAEAENERQQLLKKRIVAPNGDSAHATIPATATTAATDDGIRDTTEAARQLGSEQIRETPAVQTPTSQVPAVQSGPSQSGSSQGLEQHVQDLRRQVERLVKAPGAPLKSAPFHSASTLSPLATGTEVLILISTPYWYGVETRDGQHGWVFRDEVEPLP